MWSSIVQNGRKNRKEQSIDKIKQYIRLTDKSTFASKLSKSTVAPLRSQSNKKNNPDKENSMIKENKQLVKNRGIGVISSQNSLAMSNVLSRLSTNNMSNNELAKKSPFRINYQKTTSVLRIKKQQNYSQFDGKPFEAKSTYFLQCLKFKNRIKGQFHNNVHNSIMTFKEFMKACRIAKQKQPDLKFKSETPGRKTIVFDMDQTLIHTNQSPTSNYEIKVPFRSYQGRVGYGYVEVRPYAKQILVKLSQYFDIIIFTASTQPYADPIIDHIDPTGVVQHRLYRQSCSLIRNQIFVKDLRVLGRDLSNVVLVDNAPYSYIMQLGNAIPIIPYYKGKDDTQLISLQNYLMELKDVEDVRLFNSRYFKLHEYPKYDNHDRLIKALYPQWVN